MHDNTTTVDQALARLTLEQKISLLSGIDNWRLQALPHIGLRTITLSDGPIGVRGRYWTSADPSLALPSPTAQAATWDTTLIRRIGHLLAQEAHRKNVDVLLAPTVNMQRTPLGGRHFENFSEDPYLTGRIGTAYVTGVQEGGIATTMKHYVANDAETERFTVNNIIDQRTLRETYLRPFEMITRHARPWGLMTAYNSVNGTTMTSHQPLMNLIRHECGFDGFNVSDWTAARDAEHNIEAGLDLAMPGPNTPYNQHLATEIRAGNIDINHLDTAVRHVLTLAARVGALDGTNTTTPPEIPQPETFLRSIARQSFVLARNDNNTLPLNRNDPGKIALIGPAAREARVLGGGSATVFPTHIVSPLDGLTHALGDNTIDYHQGVDLTEELSPASEGAELTVTAVAKDGHRSTPEPIPDGDVRWTGHIPGNMDNTTFDHAVINGTITATTSGTHEFGTRGIGKLSLTVAGKTLYNGDYQPDISDPLESLFGPAVPRGTVELTQGETVTVEMTIQPHQLNELHPATLLFALLHTPPQRPDHELIAEAATAAKNADTAIIVVATTELTESEGWDRTNLDLPGRQNDLVTAVAQANPNTIVVVNAGSPVTMPWRNDVPAILLTWFPGQEGGHALADVLLGSEPGGRLPATWPATTEDAPVLNAKPNADGDLHYEEGVFIGYRAWEKRGTPQPAYWFGHGLSYTTWEYESLAVEGNTARVTVRNSGSRSGREVVQVYVGPDADTAEKIDGGIEKHRLAGFTTLEAAPNESTTVEVELDEHAFDVFDGEWTTVSGGWQVSAGRSVADLRVSQAIVQ
ncbi:beta-glucosidase [Haloglycomyces albus]|uniref:beta-glucosidase n=1 Tax=Haloglycomyces albus TaxID=526067 RepID=UPI00046CA888|nr:glycoside hydrolase family 3 C-terminal domain-containing protein [Haloglycomyces albus]